MNFDVIPRAEELQSIALNAERTKFWNKRRKQILDKKSAGSSSRLRTDYNLAYQRD